MLLPNVSAEVLNAPFDEPLMPTSVDDILKSNFSSEEIGSESSFGSHRIKTYMACEFRAYLTYVRKLVPVKENQALALGTLVHACFARHYMTGGRDTWRPIEVVEPYLPELALEARSLLYAYFAKYATVEAETWDVRAVEQEVAARLTHDGKSCPLTARVDLVVAKRERGAPTSPWGPVPQGVWLTDHKTAARMSQEYIRGYAFDFQLMTQAAIWRLADLDAVYGPLNGFMINILLKSKPPKFHRLEVAITRAETERFLHSITPRAVELYAKLQSKTKRADEKYWPQNMASCVGKYLCRMFDYCESSGTVPGVYREKA